tara:strand:+ start:6233 stop:6781 length:549 start_codon:yes stop_codon:yes gene_type:complete
MATTLEIIRGISQAAANAYDGAHMEEYSADGKARSVGLKREEGNPLIDKRVMDGFGVSFHGPMLKISYHSEVKLKDVHSSPFESDIESMINDISKFLKKEYKAITGDTLSLTAQGEVEVLVQNTSRVRTWCQAHRMYKIGSIAEVEEIKSPSEDRMDVKFRTFLDSGGFGGKRPGNDSRKKE